MALFPVSSPSSIGQLLVFLLALVAGGGASLCRGQEREPSPLPRREIRNSIGMRLVEIPAGEFVMGSPTDQPGRQDREKLHRVRLRRPFFIGVSEVTQAGYAAVMQENPSRFGRDEGRDDEHSAIHPVDSVSWHAAAAFCERLSALEAERKAGRVYRLPTEAEWEFACRAGARGLWSFGDDPKRLAEHAWYRTRGSKRTSHPVGRLRANAWGLYDMHGNLWEWCSDWYAADFGDGLHVDPTGPRHGQTKVIRGGCFMSVPAHTRCATRFHDPPAIGDDDVGFRVVMELVSEAENP